VPLRWQSPSLPHDTTGNVDDIFLSCGRGLWQLERNACHVHRKHDTFPTLLFMARLGQRR